MIKWEYCDVGSFAELEKMGSEGWEAYTVSGDRYYLKRPCAGAVGGLVRFEGVRDGKVVELFPNAKKQHLTPPIREYDERNFG